MSVALKPCAGCGRATRPSGVAEADAPGTITRATTDMCHRCATRNRGVRGAGGKNFHVVGTEPTAVFVPVRTELPLEVFKAFRAAADAQHLSVGVLLSRMAVASLTPRPKRKWVGTDVDATIRDLNASGWSDNRISKHIGLTQSSVSRRRREMGLESPTPRPARKAGA